MTGAFRRASAALVALLLTALLASCDATPELAAPDVETRVKVDTPELRKAKKQVGVAPCPEPSGPGSDLPELTLQCLGGGRPVSLETVSGPAVVSLWATWCTSCPQELPLYQRLADEAGDRLTVLGIDYSDMAPGRALALLAETETVFPQLADPGGALSDHYRVAGLPGFLMVDADGNVTFRLQLIDDYAELTDLVRSHTGVDVRAR